jgi:hypothetical protein
LGPIIRRSAVTEQATGDRVRAARRAAQATSWDASDGDLAEQQQSAEPEQQSELPSEADGLWNGDAAETPPPALPVEADPADVMEQQRAVPAEPDEYR